MIEKLSYLRKRLFAPFMVNINPAIVSWVAFLFALLASYFLFTSSWLLAAFFLLISAFLDALDGEIAREFKTASKFGDLLDHTLDRLADVAFFVALAFNQTISVGSLAFFALIAVLLASYVGTEAQALTGKRLYTAILGRADRLVVLIVASILQVFLHHHSVLAALYIILILSVLTFFQRIYITTRMLKGKH
jgi:phosphatidylglycerophosphate synthase